MYTNLLNSPAGGQAYIHLVSPSKRHRRAVAGPVPIELGNVLRADNDSMIISVIDFCFIVVCHQQHATMYASVLLLQGGCALTP